ncbi:MAG: fructose-bisphosphatase, class II [Marine Group III euryarchaeote CG-Bathy2]|uniref:Fructose-1,6-bisphosphatase n=4 Tax=Methanobacteriati TaxID=3366610 RepID=A0A075GLE5_9EURY|nr:fructose-1,6-bisphosphatase, class II (glpX) [uncultured marine group II/III euryarchaeote KM3_157_C11]AIF10362.1 fructose-1,6-bisphosphatase, class II (glpX) [uncultured marine group II/III euryarchaeote KM3_45_C02]AIF17296.1 fructose-1,6-bisphosphatase, class II (glpX) [uncultured marine group II/III euryarchaeote KM3_76_H07]OIR12963.1 MAG: fructose-bisphosphatase, class II [Marine Group III euryarchaeote CG-Bathy2]
MGSVAGLAPEFLRATEAAAIAAGSMRGCGDNKAADAAAVAAMRAVFDTIAFDGRVAIGEGERDEAPMLWIGEPLGSRQGDPAAIAVDIAIDPLECTNNCARDNPDALAVLAAAPRGALLHAPDCYMDKIAGPAELTGHVSLDAPVADNLRATADVLGKQLSEVRVIVLERPRHEQLVAEIRAAGAQLQLIGDGDIAGALRAATGEADLLLGIGAAPEGVITATALRGLGGFFEGRLHFHKPEFRARAVEMLGDDVDRLWQRDELCTSDDAVFVATGVCDGWLPGPVEGEGGTTTTSRVISVAGGSDEIIRREHAPAS